MCNGSTRVSTIFHGNNWKRQRDGGSKESGTCRVRPRRLRSRGIRNSSRSWCKRADRTAWCTSWTCTGGRRRGVSVVPTPGGALERPPTCCSAPRRPRPLGWTGAAWNSALPRQSLWFHQQIVLGWLVGLVLNSSLQSSALNLIINLIGLSGFSHSFQEIPDKSDDSMLSNGIPIGSVNRIRMKSESVGKTWNLPTFSKCFPTSYLGRGWRFRSNYDAATGHWSTFDWTLFSLVERWPWISRLIRLKHWKYWKNGCPSTRRMC